MSLITKAIPALDPEKVAASADNVADRATADLKDLVDHFFERLSIFCESHTISVVKKETP